MYKTYFLLVSCIFFLFLTMGCAESNEEKKQPPDSQQTTEEINQNNSQHTENNEEKEIAETAEYRNEKYGFTLRLPATWRDKYIVKEGNWDQQSEATYDFNYQESETNLFSVIVLKISKAEWDRDYASGLWGYLGEKDGRVFAYSVPTELPHEWQEDKQSKVSGLIDVTQMVNVDVPRIVKTFKFVN